MNEPAQPSPQGAIIDLVIGFWSAAAVAAAARLRIPDELAHGPRTAAEIAPLVGADPGALYRLMRAIATAGVVTKDAQGRFALTPAGECLRSNVPGSMRAFLTSELDNVHWLPWGRLQESVRTGKPVCEEIFSMSAWQYYRDVNPDEGRAFSESMTALSEMETRAILASYSFDGARRVVDVGGAHGAFLAAVLKAVPSAKGVLYDQPQVVNSASAALEGFGVADRVERVGGNFFERVPGGGDVYLLKHILHDWDDDGCVTILNHIREALTPDGRVVIAEMPIVEGSPGRMTALLDLNMLLMLPGKERTTDEYAELLQRAGLRMVSATVTESPIVVMEARLR